MFFSVNVELMCSRIEHRDRLDRRREREKREQEADRREKTASIQ